MVGKLQGCTISAHVPLKVVMKHKGMLGGFTCFTNHGATHKLPMDEFKCAHGFAYTNDVRNAPIGMLYLAPEWLGVHRNVCTTNWPIPSNFWTNNFANKSFFNRPCVRHTFGLMLSEWERPLCHVNGPHVTNRLRGVGTTANHGYLIRNGLWVDRNSSVHKTCNELPKKLT